MTGSHLIITSRIVWRMSIVSELLIEQKRFITKKIQVEIKYFPFFFTLKGSGQDQIKIGQKKSRLSLDLVKRIVKKVSVKSVLTRLLKEIRS